jgi:hypothetical protein
MQLIVANLIDGDPTRVLAYRELAPAAYPRSAAFCPTPACTSNNVTCPRRIVCPVYNATMLHCHSHVSTSQGIHQTIHPIILQLTTNKNGLGLTYPDVCDAQ